jgi:hypothetical protein
MTYNLIFKGILMTGDDINVVIGTFATRREAEDAAGEADDIAQDLARPGYGVFTFRPEAFACWEFCVTKGGAK